MRDVHDQLGASERSLEAEILRFLSETLQVEASRLTPTASFTVDLGLSSFDAVKLVCDIEDHFHCVIPNDRLRDLQTVGDLVHYVTHARQAA
jgi:NADH dehydrogenase (ubiquinone) 1 alpha/beta subcomplex 1